MNVDLILYLFNSYTIKKRKLLVILKVKCKSFLFDLEIL